ncbi:MAG: tRNA (adenosine(37)-N6)-threonylcarbamoyltransferase complex ATPase subunit type 1 TsaE [Bacteroidales bacterium]|nr:tRNA (adenosine(37)-N6)-threonylcarbamoyltransferase complex ATPase subunit type 1 TsaE [Bacteroidales bacterium]
MCEIIVNDLSELRSAAKKFLEYAGDTKIFAFYGEMGVGKTTFLKELCREMEVEDEITSPTFAIVNEYYSNKYGQIFHFDFYRIDDLREVYDLGFGEYLESGAYIFMEWSEKIDSILPDGITKVTITQDDKQIRTIQIKKS